MLFVFDLPVTDSQDHVLHIYAQSQFLEAKLLSETTRPSIYVTPHPVSLKRIFLNGLFYSERKDQDP